MRSVDEIPLLGIPSSGIPSLGIPSMGILSLGIPVTHEHNTHNMLCLT